MSVAQKKAPQCVWVAQGLSAGAGLSAQTWLGIWLCPHPGVPAVLSPSRIIESPSSATLHPSSCYLWRRAKSKCSFLQLLLCLQSAPHTYGAVVYSCHVEQVFSHHYWYNPKHTGWKACTCSPHISRQTEDHLYIFILIVLSRLHAQVNAVLWRSGYGSC